MGLNRNFIMGMTVLSLLSLSCGTMNKTQKGAAVGVVGGGVIGAVVGKAAGNTALGTIIGSAVGGTAGAIIGHKMDKQAEEIKSQVPNAEVIHKPGEEGIIINFKSNVLFGFDKSDLTSGAQSTVTELSKVLQKYPDTDLLIEGHTDSKGSDSYNMKLSRKRAQAVADYLENSGIKSSRMTTKGYGEEQPVASNDSEDGRAQNRRVTFVITANEKMKADAAKEANK